MAHIVIFGGERVECKYVNFFLDYKFDKRYN